MLKTIRGKAVIIPHSTRFGSTTMLTLLSYVDRIAEYPTSSNTQVTQVNFDPVNAGFIGNVGANLAFLPGFNHLSILEQVAFCALWKVDLESHPFI